MGPDKINARSARGRCAVLSEYTGDSVSSTRASRQVGGQEASVTSGFLARTPCSLSHTCSHLDLDSGSHSALKHFDLVVKCLITSRDSQHVPRER